MDTGFQSPKRRRPQPEEGPLDIIYEDESLIVLNKPAGLVVHPTYRNWSGTLLNAVLWRIRDRAGAQPGILTRLDKDTSGLVVIALTPDVHARMQRDAAGGRVRKDYLTVIFGTPEPTRGTIVLPLGRDAADRRRVVVRQDGAYGETRYEVLSPLENGRSLLRCELVTGRTHQIRVHLASSGYPIVGDALYGQRDEVMTRQALHAWRVALPHPVTKRTMEFEAPIPVDMKALVGAQNLTL